MLLEELAVWIDEDSREGPVAMAIDEWLFETRQRPLLRIYGWKGSWGSIGYFGKIYEAREAIPGVGWVRRWTGGGIVDHRADWTYSLIVPRGHGLAEMKGGKGYKAIHDAVARVLGNEAGLAAPRESPGGGLCFRNAVEHDVVDRTGTKLAGAAQRRGKRGLLHQGSISRAAGISGREEELMDAFSSRWERCDLKVDHQRVGSLVAERYGTWRWLERM